MGMWNDVKALLLEDHEIHVIFEQDGQTFYEIFLMDEARELIHYASGLRGLKELDPSRPYYLVEYHIFTEDTLDIQAVYDVFVDDLLQRYSDLDDNFKALKGESYYDQRI